MLDYNTAVLNEDQRRETLEDKAIADWESYHGTALPKGMDTEQAEELLSMADDWNVDRTKPWFYQSRYAYPLDGAFNEGKEFSYLSDQVAEHGIDWFYHRVLRDPSDYFSDQAIVNTLFGKEDPISILEFLKERGFKQWPRKQEEYK